MVLNQQIFAKYIGGKNSFGFIDDHIYTVIITEKKRGFELSTHCDTSMDHEFVKEGIPYSNEKSIRKNWDI